MSMTVCHTARSLAVIILCLASPAVACQIPVFRYALENWQPDPYVLVVAHRGDLSPGDTILLSELQETIRQHSQSLNIELKVVDLSKTKDPLLEAVLGKEAELIQSPRMVLVYPFGHVAPVYGSGRPGFRDGTPAFSDGAASSPPGLTPTSPGPPGFADGTSEIADDVPTLAWSGDLTLEHIRQCAESPARKEIAEKILDGQSAVWVLLECGDKAKDDAAEATISSTLAQMQKTLALSDKQTIQSDEFFQPDTKVDLRIEFSVIRVPYERGDETIFASTLLHTEPDLAASEDPVVIPIFGRGRSYFALAGTDINATNIEEHCRFLIGDCSCQVKRANPGKDLLFAVAWQDSIKSSTYKEIQLPQLIGVDHIEVGAPISAVPVETSDSQRSPGQAVTTETTPTATTTSAAPGISAPAITDSEASAPLGESMLTRVFGIAAIIVLVAIAGSVWLWFGTKA